MRNYKFELLGRTVLIRGFAEIPSLSRLLDMLVMKRSHSGRSHCDVMLPNRYTVRSRRTGIDTAVGQISSHHCIAMVVYFQTMPS